MEHVQDKMWWIKRTVVAVLVLAISTLLYWMSRVNYLLFHGIAEIYSIVIAAGIFIVAWNTRKRGENPQLVLLGISYALVAGIDLLHTLAFKGMNIFTDYDFYANQLWIVARFMEAASLCIFSLLFGSKYRISASIWALIWSFYTLLMLLAIFWFKIFPACFIEGKGQTEFKILAEYVICLLMLSALVFLIRRRASYDSSMFRLVALSIVLTIASEFAFTLYTDNYGVLNVVGHLFKIASFYLIYRSIIVNALQRPFDILYADLKKHEVQLEAAVVTRDKFIRIIAHDLRNPFNAILGLLDIMIAELHEGTSPKELGRHADLIRMSAQANYRLLQNLLSWAQLQSGSMRPNPVVFDLEPRINEIIAIKQGMAARKGISIQASVPPSARANADPDMFSTVLRNLLSNAIKFSDTGGLVTIEVLREGEQWRISVRDQGIGMDEELQQKLFRIDTKANRPGTADEEGTGLGLVLCREFVQLNQGKLWLESAAGKGSVFYFTVPKG